MGDNRPVGLFDSGIGGFTVLQEFQKQCPGENAIYLGDSKRMPYGELTNEKIIEYANASIRFLEARGVKAILLACNTVSSLMTEITANVPLFSIVEAGCDATLEIQKTGYVGLIATTATAKNGAYESILKTKTETLHYLTHGTPTLAKVINESPEELRLLQRNIREAIDPILAEKNIKALLLGCTHFPIVRETIERIYPSLTIINPAEKQIVRLVDYLTAAEAFNNSGNPGETEVCVTGSESDYHIFKRMLLQLHLTYTRLSLAVLDIDG